MYRQADTSSQSTTEALHLELQSANQRVTALAGLVALYEQLEEINVVDTVNSGLAVLSSRLAGLMAETPTLAEGIAAGRPPCKRLRGIFRCCKTAVSGWANIWSGWRLL
jgi:hypothetical protein